jgi:hypothetical protein
LGISYICHLDGRTGGIDSRAHRPGYGNRRRRQREMQKGPLCVRVVKRRVSNTPGHLILSINQVSRAHHNAAATAAPPLIIKHPSQSLSPPSLRPFRLYYCTSLSFARRAQHNQLGQPFVLSAPAVTFGAWKISILTSTSCQANFLGVFSQMKTADSHIAKSFMCWWLNAGLFTLNVFQWSATQFQRQISLFYLFGQQIKTNVRNLIN